ncbi:unnamed protein product [Fraxinus pennsylvanica]|uniref:Ethylene-responsive nuclear protein n=1 Tax=Fraxinus pennsylvanica TaxID=56036 RepID=A0AAD2ADY4_9LAMI|nr:unnamed protein product [Fraxinus pennsylvanica]
MRSTRISRLVNDHLRNSQRRRGDSSLVVQTGFPTSLVDLFIKNREKLKKPSKKNRARNTAIPLDDSNDPVISGSLFTSSSMHTPLLCPPPSPSPLPLPPWSRDLDEITVVDTDDGDFGARGDKRGSGVNRGVDMIRFFVTVVKIFMAVVLAMGMEKLTVGMTMSAFFLFSLEYVGKCGLLKPCSEAQEGLRLIVQTFCRFFADRKNAGVLSYDVLQVESFNPICSGLKRECGSNSPSRETQNVEPKRLGIAIAEEIQYEKEITEDSSHDGRLGCIELEIRKLIMEESISERLELKERKLRRAKMKSKIKKFVSKKLRRRKECNSESYEVSPIRKDSIAICEERHTYECEDEIEKESDFKSSSLSIGRDGWKDFVDAKCASDKLLLEANSKITLGEEKVRTETGQDSRYLCLIVLIGLIGGRIFALMIALLWCLLLKSSKTPLQRLIKLPIIELQNIQPLIGLSTRGVVPDIYNS